jgi:hypothetical protein
MKIGPGGPETAPQAARRSGNGFHARQKNEADEANAIKAGRQTG